jgi:DNA repair protein RadC
MLHQRADDPATLTGVEASKAFFTPCLQGSGRESLWVAHVDRQARCLHLARYGCDERLTELPADGIIRDAARLGSAGVILAQAHPRGAPSPAAADVRATRKLAGAADALGVTVLDHLLFAGADCTSMRRLGML